MRFSTSEKMMRTLHLYIMWIRHIRLYMYVHSPQSYNCWIRCLAIVRTYTDESQRATLELPLWEKAKGVGIVLLGDLSLFYFRSLDLFWVVFSQGLFSEFWLFDFFLAFLWVFNFRDWVKKDDRLVNQLLLGFLCGWAAFCFRSFFFWICSVVSLFFSFLDSRSALDFFFFPSEGLCSATVGKVLKGESCSWSFLLLLLVVCLIWGPDADLGILFSSVR